VERVQSPGEEIANSVSAGVGLIGAIAGIPLLLAFRKPTGQQLACCRCVGLRCDDPLALSRVHDLSRAAVKQSKAALSVTRSYGNLLLYLKAIGTLRREYERDFRAKCKIGYDRMLRRTARDARLRRG
jgi:hypothetical protein